MSFGIKCWNGHTFSLMAYQRCPSCGAPSVMIPKNEKTIAYYAKRNPREHDLARILKIK